MVLSSLKLHIEFRNISLIQKQHTMLHLNDLFPYRRNTRLHKVMWTVLSLYPLSLSIRSARMIFHLCIFVRTTSRKMNGFAPVLPFSGKSHLTRRGIVPTFIVYNLVSWGNVVRQTPSLFRPFPTILGVAKMEAFL